MFAFVLCINMAVKSRECKPRIHYSDPYAIGQHLWPSLKLTFPFLFNLHDVQSTLDFKSTSKKETFSTCREDLQQAKQRVETGSMASPCSSRYPLDKRDKLPDSRTF